ncbi:MAG: hypothetical protein ACD_58C00078G0001 [uncultured bacterium]|nr:MAG: hypothetical protein ACD_58C00078G0001 [uncultured bacterium]
MKKKFYLLLIFLTLFTFLIFQPTNILAERNSNDTENEVEDESEPDSDSINDNNLENEVKSENEVEDRANLLDDSSDKSGDSGDEDKTQTESEKKASEIKKESIKKERESAREEEKQKLEKSREDLKNALETEKDQLETVRETNKKQLELIKEAASKEYEMINKIEDDDSITLNDDSAEKAKILNSLYWAARITNRFYGLENRLLVISDKIESRLTKMTEAGAKTDELKLELRAVKDQILVYQTAIQDIRTKYSDLPKSENIELSTNSLGAQIKELKTQSATIYKDLQNTFQGMKTLSENSGIE